MKNALPILSTSWRVSGAAPSALRLQILGRRMPIYVKRFRNRIGRLTPCRSLSDLMTQFGGEPRPPDLDAFCPGSRHAGFCPFADLLRAVALMQC